MPGMLGLPSSGYLVLMALYFFCCGLLSMGKMNMVENGRGMRSRTHD